MNNYNRTPHINTSNDDEKIILDQIIRFSRQLRDAGINVNLTNIIDLLNSLKYIDIKNQHDFYSANCATLVSSHQDLAFFEQLYHSFWYEELVDQQIKKEAEAKDKNDLKDDIPDNQEKKSSLQIDQQNQSLATDDSKEPKSSNQPEYSSNEYLIKKDLAFLSEEELKLARSLISELIRIIVNHKSRRLKNDRKGRELYFRKMLRQNALYGSDGIKTLFRNKRIKKIKLVLLCDVSGSMEQYSRFLIHIIYAMHKELNQLEVAVFSTHLTVITDCLKNDNIDDSLDNISKMAHDWAGGTNIGQCLWEFNHNFSQKIFSHRSVTIILSDGWDQGDSKIMANEMRQLHKSSHKIIWLNPLLSDSEYQPLCQGMTTALPYIDYFLPAHNLESFAELMTKLKQIWH